MKLLPVILALTVLNLSVIPCSDEHACDSDAHEHTALGHNHEPTANNDHCSPLCSCACCGLVFTFPERRTETTDLFEQESIFNFHYSFGYSFSFPNSVWHPPSHC